MESTYNYANRIENGKKSITTLDEKDQNAINTFVAEYGTDNSVSDGRKAKYYFVLKGICERLGGDLENPTTTKLRNFFESLKKSEYTEATKSDYYASIKMFYRWWKNKNRKNLSEEQDDAMNYLFEVFKWRSDRQAVQAQRKDILEETDVKRLIDACFKPRDKAIISLFYDLGLRVGELVKLEIRHLKPYAHGFLVDIQYSKKIPRAFPVIQSAPYLETWLQHHPDKNNPNAPLFTKNGSNPLTVASIESQLKRLQLRANLNRSTKVNPHLFRHSGATRDANAGWSEAHLCKKYGWVIGSKAVAKYIRVANLNAVKIAEQHAGITPPDEEEKSLLEPVKCQCGAVNEPTNLYCKNCHLQLLQPGENFNLDKDSLKEFFREFRELKAIVKGKN